MVDEELDVAMHPPVQHALDPYKGRLVTRRVGERVEVVVADQHILLGCPFLWDIVANAETFAASGVSLIPPVPKLGLVANFDMAQKQTITMLDLVGMGFPTNRPTMHDMRPMCQHWTLRIEVGGRVVAYRIGAYRPSVGCMEASWVD